MKDYKQHRAPKMPYQLKLLIAAVIGLIVALDAQDAESSEQSCLEKIAYAESRGETKEQKLAVMKAAKNHAKQRHVSICKVRAVKRAPPPKERVIYAQMAKSVLATKYTGKANSWRRHCVKKQCDNQFFYVARL